MKKIQYSSPIFWTVISLFFTFLPNYSHSQNSCGNLYLDEPTRSGYLESNGFVKPGDKIEICFNNNTIKVGDYFNGWISNVQGTETIICNFEIISTKFPSNLKGKIGIDSKNKLFQMAEYVRGRPTGEQMIFEYINEDEYQKKQEEIKKLVEREKLEIDEFLKDVNNKSSEEINEFFLLHIYNEYFNEKIKEKEKLNIDEFLMELNNKSLEECIDFIGSLMYDSNKEDIKEKINKSGRFNDLFTGKIDESILFDELINLDILSPQETYQVQIQKVENGEYQLNINGTNYKTNLIPTKEFITCNKSEILIYNTSDFDDLDTKGIVVSEDMSKALKHPKYGELYFFIVKKKGKFFVKYGFNVVVDDQDLGSGITRKGFGSKSEKYDFFVKTFLRPRIYDSSLKITESYPFSSIYVYNQSLKEKVYIPNPNFILKIKAITGFE